ncbi:hypothetical protein Nepgr_009953 [Nepenthes gracilis]|uniref:Uncharacterized protein n=1 Tax=Nepenthes gracilis TaxID=150966 RepID=A0AAD3XKL8_NEPGR|nr:hypothetical protein Nepgr_009953 [Nepenthes gracilis]
MHVDSHLRTALFPPPSSLLELQTSKLPLHKVNQNKTETSTLNYCSIVEKHQLLLFISPGKQQRHFTPRDAFTKETAGGLFVPHSSDAFAVRDPIFCRWASQIQQIEKWIFFYCA